MCFPPPSIPIVFVHNMLAGRGMVGQPVHAWLLEAGISPALLDHAAARVTVDQYARLMRVLIARSGDEALGFLSRSLRPGTLALIARDMLGASTLDGAVRRLTRSFGLVQDDFAMSVLHDGNLTAVALHSVPHSADQPVFVQELLLRVFWRLLAWLAGGRLPVKRFDLAFSQPPLAASYAQLFPGSVVFDQTCSAFWFDSRRLQAPVRRDEAALHDFLADAQTQIIIPRRGEGSLVARVRAHLLSQQPDWPGLVPCAAALNMAASTLQRRLAQENSSFRAVKDSLRRDMAIARLNSSDVPLAILAADLGFSDSATFQRAFKGWTGVSPGNYRRHTR